MLGRRRVSDTDVFCNRAPNFESSPSVEEATLSTHYDENWALLNGSYLVLQRDFTFLIEPDVAYDATDKPLHGDAGNN